MWNESFFCAPQLKRDPLDAPSDMAQSQPSKSEIEAEFRRIGITWRSFAELVRENERLDIAPEGLAIALGPQTWALLKSLPDGAGQEHFLKSFKQAFGGRDAGA